MKTINLYGARIFLLATVLAAFALTATTSVFAQDLNQRRAEAMKLVRENRYIDALPIFEEIAVLLPKDAEVWAHYGVAILVNSSTLETPAARKAERKRAIQALTKAKQLGTDVVTALHYLDVIPPDGGDADAYSSDAEVDKYIREGEGHFGRGEYAEAFKSYEKAYKLNPKSYEAALFMGDSLYGAKRYADSEKWFAKAAEIDPDREEAYRYWGDALFYQGKSREGYRKIAEAFIADPFSRVVRDRFFRAVEEVQGRLAPGCQVIPPGGKISGDIKFDFGLLRAENGTIYWKLYDETHLAWQMTEFGKRFPDEKEYRRSLPEETAALRKVVEAVKKDTKLKTPDESLTNLVKLDEAGLLEAYIFFVRPNSEIFEDYYDYRKNNRDKLRLFLFENFFVF
ncbi:MAG: tetratricopeptide repeat protein [Acidobacteria bacterium]|nr:tetratricopeptide repeat protein [Acidobacteriota bacterium]